MTINGNKIIGVGIIPATGEKGVTDTYCIALRYERNKRTLFQNLQKILDLGEDAPILAGVWDKYTKTTYKRDKALVLAAEFAEKIKTPLLKEEEHALDDAKARCEAEADKKAEKKALSDADKAALAGKLVKRAKRVGAEYALLGEVLRTEAVGVATLADILGKAVIDKAATPAEAVRVFEALLAMGRKAEEDAARAVIAKGEAERALAKAKAKATKEGRKAAKEDAKRKAESEAVKGKGEGLTLKGDQVVKA